MYEALSQVLHVVIVGDPEALELDQGVPSLGLPDPVPGHVEMDARGLAALLLAAAGFYGVMSFLVTRRTRGIGVRIALGASLRDIVAGVIRSGGQLVLAGSVVGLAGFLALRRFAEALVFGVSPADPLPPTLAVLPLALVGLMAAWGPARRAGRIEPREPMRGR